MERMAAGKHYCGTIDGKVGGRALIRKEDSRNV